MLNKICPECDAVYIVSSNNFERHKICYPCFKFKEQVEIQRVCVGCKKKFITTQAKNHPNCPECFDDYIKRKHGERKW